MVMSAPMRVRRIHLSNGVEESSLYIVSFCSTKRVYVDRTRNSETARRDGVVGRVERAAHRAIKTPDQRDRKIHLDFLSVSVGDISRLRGSRRR